QIKLFINRKAAGEIVLQDGKELIKNRSKAKQEIS
ncbi:MAG: hypothetical protein K0S18_406, partial [Anaerocolumna sp.]|nr:hypothetical protein [Anaerocolumna sp.]